MKAKYFIALLVVIFTASSLKGQIKDHPYLKTKKFSMETSLSKISYDASLPLLIQPIIADSLVVSGESINSSHHTKSKECSCLFSANEEFTAGSGNNGKKADSACITVLIVGGAALGAMTGALDPAKTGGVYGGILGGAFIGLGIAALTCWN